MAIKIEDIRKEAETHGWTLLSDKYENLESEMKWKCEEGHEIYLPYKKVRNKYECPVCKKNEYKNLSNKVIPKKKGKTRFLALDQATYVTGWAVIDGDELISYGVFEASGNTEVERFYKIKMWLLSMLAAWHPDKVGLEGVQFQQWAGVTTFQTLARLQGVLLETLYEEHILNEVIHTATWRKHCGVKGKGRKEKKESMINLIKEWYDVTVSDDIADAIGICKYVADNYTDPYEYIFK